MEYIRDEIVYDGKYTQFIKRYFLDKNKQEQIWEMAKRKTYGRIVAVLPITLDGNILLTKNYRVPMQSYVIECCAGLMDKKGESEEEAIKREMLEETGYATDDFVKIVDGPFNTGLLADEMVVFAAFDAKKIQEPELEATEDLEIIEIPIIEVFNFLKHPPPHTKVDIKLFGFIFLAKQELEKRKKYIH